MDWNTTESLDNLQVFIVVKFSDIRGYPIKDGFFGDDNMGWDRFISLESDGKKDYLLVGGSASSNTKGLFIHSFPPDANPLQISDYFVSSVHWNNKGDSQCGPNKSTVYCNGKKTFEKRFTPDQTEELFTIKAVKDTKPPTYTIQDLLGESLVGSFYEKELQRANQQTYRIERVVKKRMRNGESESFVKWSGYPNKFNTWMRTANLEKIGLKIIHGMKMTKNGATIHFYPRIFVD